MADHSTVLDTIETQIAYLMRMGEASRRATAVRPHRALDQAAYVILRCLQDEGPQNVSAIADRLNLDGSTVTRQVTALQLDALIERRPDPRDGRGTVIEPTPLGLKQVDEVRAARRELYDKVLAGWSDTDRDQLAAHLSRLTHAMDTFVKSA